MAWSTTANHLHIASPVIRPPPLSEVVFGLIFGPSFVGLRLQHGQSQQQIKKLHKTFSPGDQNDPHFKVQKIFHSFAD